MSYSRHTGPADRALRAADADREAVAELLRREHLAGRLDDEELDARLDGCFAAVSYADLDALVADLPGDEPRRRRGGLRPAFFWPVPLLPLFLVAVVASHGHALWLLAPLVLLAVFSRRRLGGWACGGRTRAVR
jgi:hypothetical protein